MLVLVIFLFFSVHLAESALDINCTEPDATGTLHLAPSAIKHCVDLHSFSICRHMFGADTAPKATVTPTADFGRAAVCYQVANVPSEELKQAAILICPLYCGFCCVSPAVLCPNAPSPRLDCNTITDDMCDSILWRELIASDCPGACGFCLLGGCIDAVPDCATQPTICSNTAMANFTQANCRRTCNLCTTTAASCGSSTISGSTSCTDRSTSCPLWNRNGFCASVFYTPDQKRDYCSATCGLC